MDFMPMQKIKGQIRNNDKEQYQFAQGTKIEIFNQSLSASGQAIPGKWLGSASVRYEGSFELFIAPEVQPELYCRISYGENEVSVANTKLEGTDLYLPLAHTDYLRLTGNDADCMPVIKGHVSLGPAEITAVPTKDDIFVAVFKPGMPDPILIGQGTINIYGNYEIYIDRTMLQSGILQLSEVNCSEDQFTEGFYVCVLEAGGRIIARSVDLQLDECCTIVNLHVDERQYFDRFYAELEHLFLLLEQFGIGDGALANIDPADGQAIRSLFLKTNIDTDLLITLIYACNVHYQYGIDLKIAYAFSKGINISIREWAEKELTILDKIVNDAKLDRLIGDAEGLGPALDLLRSLRTTWITDDRAEDGTPLLSLFSTIFQDDVARNRQFVDINLQYANEPVEAMWQAVRNEFGPEETSRIQYGLQTIAITGMQQQMSNELINNRPPLKDLARDYTPDDWRSLVSEVCNTHEQWCIPPSIIEEAAGDGQIMIELYGNKLYNLVTDAYATSILGDKFANGIFEFSEDPQQTAHFIQVRPDLDLRTQNIWDYNFDGDTPVSVRNDLQPVQNLLKVAAGKPELVTQMLIDGIRSSSDIAEMSSEAFVAAYSGVTPTLTTDALQAVHKNAAATSLVVSGTKAWVEGAIDTPGIALPGFSVELWEPNPGPSVNPDLETLFGSLDLCSCSECTSMYSPAAYYTDILNFIKSKLAATPPTVYNELVRRRPDLIHIDLTCKNTNTLVPYIDLVNELLELAILKANGIAMPAQFKSYQTSGSSLELEAYPEHTFKNNAGIYVADTTYEQVYNDILSTAVFNNSLPFNLPLEESRTYLSHLGYQRYELMMKFKPVKDYIGMSGIPGINEYNAMAEWLHLSRNEADIITRNANPDLPTDDQQYFGYSGLSVATWTGLLLNGNTAPGDHGEKGLNNILKRAGITYKELLELLNTDFLNKEISAGVRPLKIKSTNAANPASCQLHELILEFTPGGLTAPEIFNRWYRFLRLQKAAVWSSYHLDIVLESLSVATLNVTDFIRIVQLHQLCSDWKTGPEKLSAFLKRINTHTYINYKNDSQNDLPSVYDSLFKNKALVNPPEPYFNNVEAIAGTYQERSGTIVAAFNIKEEEFFMLLDFLAINKTSAIPAVTGLNILSRVYGLVQLAKGTGLSVKELIRSLRLSDTVGATLISRTPADLMDFLQAKKTFIERSKSLLFTLPEMAYLIANSDEEGIFIPQDAAIQLFYESLRAELKKLVTANESSALVSEDLKNALYNVCIQKFSTEFGWPNDTAYYVIKDVVSIATTLVPPDTALIDALIRTEFINALVPPPSTGPDPLIPLPVTEDNGIDIYEFSALYEAYRRINKIAYLNNRYKLSVSELEFFIAHSVALDVVAINALPIDVPATTTAQASGLFRLNDWIKVKGLYNLRVSEYLNILGASLGSATKTDWHNNILERTEWTSEDLQFLTGNDTGTGKLNTTYSNVTANNDFRKGALLLQLFELMNSVTRIGLTTVLTYNALKTDVQMTDSGNIRKAAKSKHSDAAWSKVAKPLQDTLRERQRQAMVAYLVVRPEAGDPVGSQMRWTNENGLFAYYLIDVAMQPCMRTSRIKQGISSVQLYMDRTILNLENVNGIPSNHISIRPDLIAQWRTWRKWYRVWEANRKIFLYPENWIEPELRDNKTPFFRELETQLLQDEVKDDKVEDAFRAYLEQVEEVGRLDPVSAYHQVEKDSSGKIIIDRTHVIARTSVMPHRYFYRILENKEWTPWEKVNADIKSDHVIPVIWNRKLYLFWLTFRFKRLSDEAIADKKKEMKFSTGPSEWLDIIDNKPRMGASNNTAVRIAPEDISDAFSNIEVTLNWSQYKDNKWLASELSKDTMTFDLSKVVLSQIGLSSYSNTVNAQKILSWLNNRGDIGMDELFRNRVYFFHTFENTANESAGINFSIMFSPGLDETATGIHSFFWRGDNSKDPYVVRDTEKGYQVLAPTGTRFNKMKFVEDPFGDGKLRRDNTSFSPTSTVPNQYFSFSTFKVENYPGIVRGSNNPILDTTSNGVFNIAARSSINGNPHYHFHNPMLSEFLFDDDKNTYFVKWEDLNLVTTDISKTDSISFGKVAEYTAVAYTGAAASAAMSSLSGTVSSPSYSFSGNALASALLTGGYRFHTFYHPQIFSFIKALNKDGIPGLLRIENQRQINTMNFEGNYKPTSLVLKAYPQNNVQFKIGDAYSIYNWEIFFHAPMLIAQRLSDNQQFEQAQKWYHYIFDPTSNTNANGSYSVGIERFWKFYPFYELATLPVQTLSDLLAAINNGVSSAVAQVTQWEQNPFNPHLIARMRVLAYMKNVLMKYLDNLIAWGDQLFRRDTIESINEATQLYILANNLLGERPKEIPPRAKVAAMTFNELVTGGGLDALSNAMVSIESFFSPNTGAATGTTSTGAPIYGKMFYFCLPKNDKLMSYWDTLADRLFKIRNCMNIEGTVRQLPLFEPPIDPALLVRATAMGVDINSVLNSVSVAALPHYRFTYMLQKANEFCNEVKSLGGALLSALEKKDGEELALLRSGHELKMLERIRAIREQQVREAEENLEALRLTRGSIEIRFQYYSSRAFMNPNEQKHLQSIQTGLVLQAIQSGMFGTISALALIPQFHGQGPMAIGASFGGDQLSRATNAINAGLTVASVINNAKGTMAATLGGYERRREDWTFQADTASKELEQVDKQILAAEIRLDVARKELSNQELQLEQTTETDSYMRSKFTNAELYSWMSSQVSATYFQSYQLAYDLAKRTEVCFNNELPAVQAPVGGFIKFGYWDSLRKGLLSGDKLQFDLRKMEASYIDSNRRELELSKSFSLAMMDPAALISLRKDGACIFDLDKIWFDLDFPGHYLRRIKSVSISIPCVAGPYTTIAATLQMTSNTIMKTDAVADAGETVTIATNAIATSSGQNDAGMFELNFRDERYIPFENAGVISSWRLNMMEDAGLRQLDYDGISDVIIHLNYTARNSSAKAGPTIAALNAQLSSLSTGITLPRYFSLKHEFSNEWYAGFSRLADLPAAATGREMNLVLKRSMFPQYAKDKEIRISTVSFKLRPKQEGVYKLLSGSTVIELDNELTVNMNLAPEATEQAFSFILYKEVGGIPAAIMEEELSDLYFILNYKLG